MTLPAVDTWDLRGIDGPHYTVASHCSNPDCKRIAEHVHHIVRRSALSGDYAWVMLYGKPVGNLTGLCPYCHDDITGLLGGHKAAIRFNHADSTFYWCSVTSEGADITYTRIAPLVPQPPTPETLAERSPGATHTESENCPFCGQTRRRKTLPRPGESHAAVNLGRSRCLPTPRRTAPTCSTRS